MNVKITSTVVIRPDACLVNGEIVLSFQENSDDGWFRQIYRFLQPDYPKFHKMDQLSQAAFLTVELLKKEAGNVLMTSSEESVALIFANRESSSVTDSLFIDSYQRNGSPSPSLFVYTLPNILLGELSIRNKWYGENIFAVFPKFALDYYEKNARILLDDQVSVILCGWVNVTEGKQEILVFTIENEPVDDAWNQLMVQRSGFEFTAYDENFNNRKLSE